MVLLPGYDIVNSFCCGGSKLFLQFKNLVASSNAMLKVVIDLMNEFNK